MPKCEECGSQNMLVKVAENKFLCFEHYQQSRVSDSETEALIREYFDKNIDYLDVVYRKKIRKLKERERNE